MKVFFAILGFIIIWYVFVLLNLEVGSEEIPFEISHVKQVLIKIRSDNKILQFSNEMPSGSRVKYEYALDGKVDMICAIPDREASYLHGMAYRIAFCNFSVWKWRTLGLKYKGDNILYFLDPLNNDWKVYFK
jgi:hypothetical protein